MKDNIPVVVVGTIMLFVLTLLLGSLIGSKGEISRLEQKCLVEMQDKIHKEATTICNERVK